MAEQHDFGRLLATLRASWWLIAILVVIAAVGAYAVSLATPSRYRSAETLIYLPAGGTTDVDAATATRDLQTAVGLVQAAPVLGPAAKQLGVTQDELRASVTACCPPTPTCSASRPPPRLRPTRRSAPWSWRRSSSSSG